MSAKKETPTKTDSSKKLVRSKSVAGITKEDKSEKKESPSKSEAKSPAKTPTKESKDAAVPPLKKANTVKKLNVEKAKAASEWEDADIKELEKLITLAERPKIKGLLQKALEKGADLGQGSRPETPNEGSNTVRLAIAVAHETPLPSTFHNPVEVFKKFNKTGSGFIDAKEFTLIMAELGMPISEEMARITINALIDKNGDGVVDLDEFISWYEKLGK